MEALRLFFVKPSLYFKTIMCVPHLQDEVIDVTFCPGFTGRTLFSFFCKLPFSDALQFPRKLSFDRLVIGEDSLTEVILCTLQREAIWAYRHRSPAVIDDKIINAVDAGKIVVVIFLVINDYHCSGLYLIKATDSLNCSRVGIMVVFFDKFRVTEGGVQIFARFARIWK